MIYEPKWIKWARNLQAIAQNGLAFSKNPFDTERYSYVSRIAAEMLSEGTGINTDKLASLFAAESGYATPKVDTRGVVFRDNKILLVRELSDGLWTLPGGWADVNESPAEAVVREIAEESGYTARVLKLLAVYDRSKHPHFPVSLYHIYKIFFLCEITGGSPEGSNETGEVDFFTEDKLPGLSVARITKDQIARMFEHYRNPSLQVDFD